MLLRDITRYRETSHQVLMSYLDFSCTEETSKRYARTACRGAARDVYASSCAKTPNPRFKDTISSPVFRHNLRRQLPSVLLRLVISSGVRSGLAPAKTASPTPLTFRNTCRLLLSACKEFSAPEPCPTLAELRAGDLSDLAEAGVSSGFLRYML